MPDAANVAIRCPAVTWSFTFTSGLTWTYSVITPSTSLWIPIAFASVGQLHVVFTTQVHKGTLLVTHNTVPDSIANRGVPKLAPSNVMSLPGWIVPQGLTILICCPGKGDVVYKWKGV
ncbi:hypothetical protein [Bacillus nitratireducens]|uniref:hypothetical protein n=1 Tax=Bacillus nitratireducens TaxID=2026193 RepID=UPI002E1EA14F|nr:hypothetical protein [Bacillus nitratireducens]